MAREIVVPLIDPRRTPGEPPTNAAIVRPSPICRTIDFYGLAHKRGL